MNNKNQTILKKIWFLIAPLFLLVGLLIVPMLPRDIECPTVTLYGHQCVFCGATRSFEYFHQFNWLLSIQLNPFTFFVLLCLWSFSLLYLLSYIHPFIKHIFNLIINFLYTNFFMVFGFFIMLYLLQYLFRIIFN